MKTIRIYKIAAIVLILAASAGCKKDYHKSKKADGIVLNFGNVEADGCGWVIRIDQIDYSPNNLDNTFKQDSLPVKITYDQLETRFQCGLAANIGLPEINLKNIKKK